MERNTSLIVFKELSKIEVTAGIFVYVRESAR
jgi:hypothetical protein